MKITPDPDEIVQGVLTDQSEMVARSRRQDLISRVLNFEAFKPANKFDEGIAQGRRAAMEMHQDGRDIEVWPAMPTPPGGKKDDWSEGYRQGQEEIKALFRK